MFGGKGYKVYRFVFLEEFGCGLWTDTGDSLYVVGGVSGEGEEVGNLVWTDAEFVDDGLLGKDFAFAKNTDRDSVVYELHNVFVDGKDVAGFVGKGCDDVVRFVTGGVVLFETKETDDFEKVWVEFDFFFLKSE